MFLVRLFRRFKKVVRKKVIAKHYLVHKEQTRELVLARLEYFNQYYRLQWKRVAIKNQRRCWGSCSSLKNLNFNYKILFLPPHLQDYIVVHEMCHLAELNHGKRFWQLIEQTIPDYQRCVAELKVIDRGGGSIKHLLAIQESYLSGAIKRATPVSDEETSFQPYCSTCGHSVVCNCSFDIDSA